MNKIQKVIKVGDFVYSSTNGKPMKIIKINGVGFYTKEGFVSYDNHRKLYYLTKRAYLDQKSKGKKEGFSNE